MQDPSHNDILKRVEKVEIDVAVLDSKTNRLHEDLVDIKADMKLNGAIAREVKTKVDGLPRYITILLGVFTLAIAGFNFLQGTI